MPQWTTCQQLKKLFEALLTVVHMSKRNRQETSPQIEYCKKRQKYISRSNMILKSWHTLTNQHLHVRIFGFDIAIFAAVPCVSCKHKQTSHICMPHPLSYLPTSCHEKLVRSCISLPRYTTNRHMYLCSFKPDVHMWCKLARKTALGIFVK